MTLSLRSAPPVLLEAPAVRPALPPEPGPQEAPPRVVVAASLRTWDRPGLYRAMDGVLARLGPFTVAIVGSSWAYTQLRFWALSRGVPFENWLDRPGARRQPHSENRRAMFAAGVERLLVFRGPELDDVRHCLDLAERAGVETKIRPWCSARQWVLQDKLLELDSDEPWASLVRWMRGQERCPEPAQIEPLFHRALVRAERTGDTEAIALLRPWASAQPPWHPFDREHWIALRASALLDLGVRAPFERFVREPFVSFNVEDGRRYKLPISLCHERPVEAVAALVDALARERAA